MSREHIHLPGATTTKCLLRRLKRCWLSNWTMKGGAEVRKMLLRGDITLEEAATSSGISVGDFYEIRG